MKTCHWPYPYYFRCSVDPYIYNEDLSLTISLLLPVQCRSIYVYKGPVAGNIPTTSIYLLPYIYFHISTWGITFLVQCRFTLTWRAIHWPHAHYFRYNAGPYTYIDHLSLTIYPRRPVQCSSIYPFIQSVPVSAPIISGRMHILLLLGKLICHNQLSYLPPLCT